MYLLCRLSDRDSVHAKNLQKLFLRSSQEVKFGAVSAGTGGQETLPRDGPGSMAQFSSSRGRPAGRSAGPRHWVTGPSLGVEPEGWGEPERQGCAARGGGWKAGREVVLESTPNLKPPRRGATKPLATPEWDTSGTLQRVVLDRGQAGPARRGAALAGSAWRGTSKHPLPVPLSWALDACYHRHCTRETLEGEGLELFRRAARGENGERWETERLTRNKEQGTRSALQGRACSGSLCSTRADTTARAHWPPPIRSRRADFT